MDKECCNINGAIKEFYNSLLAYTTNKVQDSIIAEDIVQEVMYRFSVAYSNKEKIDHIRGWLFHVTKNIINDHFKNGKRTQRINVESLNEVFDDEDEFTILDGIIEQMIRQLPEMYSNALLMSDIEKVPQTEISNILNISISATKMRVQRARKMLHEMILDCCDISYDRKGNFISCTIKDTCSPLLEIEKDLLNNYR